MDTNMFVDEYSDKWALNVRHSLYNSPLYSPLYLLAHLCTLSAFAAVYFRGYWSFSTLVFQFGVLTLLDFFMGSNVLNPTRRQSNQQERAWYYHWHLCLALPLLASLTLWACYVASTAKMAWWEFLGIAISVGIINGSIGSLTAHELMHKKKRLTQLYGEAILLFMSYMPFFIEHIKIHHVHYGTPKDPATSLFGESFYHYFPRTVRGKLIDAWAIERARLERRNFGFWSWHNQMIWFFALPALLAGFLGAVWGSAAVLFFFLQSFIAIVTLEVVTFIQHYGLVRKETAPGEFERGTGAHSWDTYLRISNFFFLQMPRHYDHHVHMSRWYHVLNSYPESAMMLPAGYPAMCLLALIPPLWHKVMDPRVMRLRAASERNHHYPTINGARADFAHN